MLEKLLRLYTMAMAFDVRSPMPHLVGPPGTGKSSVAEELAGLIGVNLHIINVSRLSPLEVEGVQMPHGTGDEMALRMLPATFWTGLKHGDIVLFDEFLRGFPEVYNALLEIFTSRRVGAHRLPKVFILGASNSVRSYDPALEDRLLHIPVADARKSKAERERIGRLIVEAVGLMPEMANGQEMEDLITNQVLPSYEMLDAFKKRGTKVSDEMKGVSVRHIIGQAQLRYVTINELKSLIEFNNRQAMAKDKIQYVVLALGARNEPQGYAERARKLVGNPKLTDLQALNLEMNLQMIDMYQAEKED